MKYPSRPFGEIADLRNGVNFVVADQGVTVKIVGVADFRDRSELSNFDELAQVRLRSTLRADDELQDGDLLLVRSNGNKSLVGRCIVIKNPPAGVTFSGFTIRARLEKLVALPEYVALVFQSGALKRQMAFSGGGNGNISNLNQTLLATMPISLPNTEIQAALVRLISAWDAAIQKNEQLIAAKEQKNLGIMRCLLTGKRRLHGFKGRWTNRRLGELFQERTETGLAGLPLLSVVSGEGIVPQSTLGRRDISNEDKAKYLRIFPGDIGYNTMRMWQGVSALSCYEGIVSPAYTICVPSAEIDGRFASYLFKLPAVVHRFYRYSQGLTSDTWNLKFRHFSEIEVRVPEIGEQVAIASTLALLDRELALLRKLRHNLAQQKRGVMEKLFTGEWRLPLPEQKVL